MAVNLSTADLESAAGLTSAQAVRLLPVATMLVERYAPSAPTEIQNEAVIRVVGHMRQAPAGLRKLGIGTVDIEYDLSGQRAMFRNSGAAALLTSWKKRRAGAIG